MFHPSMSALYGNPYGGMPPSMMGYSGPAPPSAYPGGMEYDMMARYAQIYRAHQQAHMGHSGSPGACSPSSSGRSSFESQRGGGSGRPSFESQRGPGSGRPSFDSQRGGGAASGNAGGGGPHPPAPPPLPPGAAPPGQHMNPHPPQYHPITAEALARYQAMYHGGEEYWEGDGEEEEGSNTDSSKQSVARRRHARRRRQLARLAAERLEWEVRSRQMEAALMQKSGDGAEGPGALPENLFADFRKALAKALLLTSEVVEHDDGDDDGDPYEESTATSQTLSEADSEELANQLVSELRGVSLDDEAESKAPVEGDANEGNRTAKDSTGEGVIPARVSHGGAARSYRRASGAVSLSKYLNSFSLDARGAMFSPLSHACFDPTIAGIEGIIALDHGLNMAQESGLFAPGELLVTAVSTKDLLTRFSGGGCGDVVGAPAERMVGTSLLSGLHAEDIRNLVFAFHLFPTILPEVECDKAGKDGDAKEKDGSDGTSGPGWTPAPSQVRLLPHGFLHRRHVSGAFVSMERLGGVIITNDAAARAKEAKEQSRGAGPAVGTEKGETDKNGETDAEAATAPTDKEERPFPTEEEIAKTIVEEPAVEASHAPPPTTATVSTPTGDITVVLNKYHPSNKKDATPAGSTSAVRSALSAPVATAGRSSSMTASASPFAPNLAREKSVTEGLPVKVDVGSKPAGAGEQVGVVKKVGSVGTDANAKTSEADLSSLVAHCVRHAKKATVMSVDGRVDGDELPEGIKDVLLRLTRETFSEHTMLVTIERVRKVGGTVGSEVRHNSQMMVVSKLLNDLATRKHRALPEKTPHTMSA